MEALEILFNSPWYWLIAGVLLAAAEAAAPGILLLWIGLGAIAVGIFVAIWPDAPLTAQLIVLAICMLAAVLSGIRYQSRAKNSDEAGSLNSGLTNYVGRQATAISDFQSGSGRVRVDDTFYSATSPDPVAQGETVIIRAVHNGVFLVGKGLKSVEAPGGANT
jgi:membrane protein implicated in regulation of membrane protease activity